MFRRSFSLLIILSICLVLSASGIYEQLEERALEPDLASPIREEKVLDPEDEPRAKEPLYTKQDIGQQVEQRTIEQERLQQPLEQQPPVQQNIIISLAGDCTLGTDESFSYVNSFPYQVKKQNEDWSYFCWRKTYF